MERPTVEEMKAFVKVMKWCRDQASKEVEGPVMPIQMTKMFFDIWIQKCEEMLKNVEEILNKEKNKSLEAGGLTRNEN